MYAKTFKENSDESCQIAGIRWRAGGPRRTGAGGRTSRVIDYRGVPFEKVLKVKVDVVFDLIGGDTQKQSFLVLKEGGHWVSAVQPVSQKEAAKHRVSGVMMRLTPSAEMLGNIGRLVEEGTIRPDVASVYSCRV
jgi:NADPH:quinone reductase-like Zn-dependent oxidoreductase